MKTKKAKTKKAAKIDPSKSENNPEALDAIAISQLTWKSHTMAKIACRIVTIAIKQEYVWPDEVDNSDVFDHDKNCIGSVFRQLAMPRVAIIERVESVHRRSMSENSNGRTIFPYRLLSESKARTFLARNNALANLRDELFPIETITSQRPSNENNQVNHP